MIYCILLCAVIIVVIIIIGVVKTKKADMIRMYKAAHKVVLDEYLDRSLSNPMDDSAGGMNLSGTKLMIRIKTKIDNRSEEYIFDPGVGIYIGRNAEGNSIIVDEATVSLQHCYLYVYNNKLVLMDCNSSNGIIVKRGLKRHLVINGESIYLEDKDILRIGSVNMKLHIFYYDPIWM